MFRKLVQILAACTIGLFCYEMVTRAIPSSTHVALTHILDSVCSICGLCCEDPNAPLWQQEFAMYLEDSVCFAIPVVISLLVYHRFAFCTKSFGYPCCRKCGYSLRGLQTPRCPECGTRI